MGEVQFRDMRAFPPEQIQSSEFRIQSPELDGDY